MGFFKTPKVPKPVPPANSPILARDLPNPNDSEPFGGFASLISTSSSGLKRKASTQKTSLIGG